MACVFRSIVFPDAKVNYLTHKGFCADIYLKLNLKTINYLLLPAGKRLATMHNIIYKSQKKGPVRALLISINYFLERLSNIFSITVSNFHKLSKEFS